MSALDITAADVATLAQQRTRFELSEPIARFERLCVALRNDAPAAEAQSARTQGLEIPPTPGPDDSRIVAALQFSQDSQGRSRVSGRLRVAVTMACNRCLEAKQLPLEAELRLTLLDEPGFERLLPEEQTALDVAIVDLKAADLLTLIEDELLLALPTRVCVEDDCPRLPPMSFAPVAEGATSSDRPIGTVEAAGDGASTVPADRDRQRPFAGLKRLLEQGQDQEDG